MQKIEKHLFLSIAYLIGLAICFSWGEVIFNNIDLTTTIIIYSMVFCTCYGIIRKMIK